MATITQVTSGRSETRSLRVAEALKRMTLIAVSVALGELLAKALWFWVVLDRLP